MRFTFLTSMSSQSIEDLFSGAASQPDGGESAAAKFAVKQKQLRTKELERLTKTKADAASLPYVDLVGFPISPEALVLIDEAEGKMTFETPKQMPRFKSAPKLAKLRK